MDNAAKHRFSQNVKYEDNFQIKTMQTKVGKVIRIGIHQNKSMSFSGQSSQNMKTLKL